MVDCGARFEEVAAALKMPEPDVRARAARMRLRYRPWRDHDKIAPKARP